MTTSHSYRLSASWLSRTLLLALLLGVLATLAPATPAQAASLVVTSTNNSGPGSLREALENAASGDTITFDAALSGKTVLLTSGQLNILKNVTVQGLGGDKLTISGNQTSGIFEINKSVFVTLANMTIADGGNGFGGGVVNRGVLTINNSVIRNNQADLGGGIANNGVLTINNSTISDNQASNIGGGIINGENSFITLTNSTVSGNRASAGGGVNNQGTLMINNSTISSNAAANGVGGIDNIGTLTVKNSTITDNLTNNANDSRRGGGIFNSPFGSASTQVGGSIVVGNIDVSGESPDVGGAFVSLGNNIIGTGGGSGGFTNGVNGDQVGTNATPIDAKLGLLANNGGITHTHLPLAGSPAVDTGGSVCPTSDQRGVNRPQGVACDVGALEVVVDPPAPTGSISVASGGTCAVGSASGTINLLVDQSNVSLTATSSDQSLLPDNKLVVSGSGTKRFFTLTAATGKSGIAQVTITAGSASTALNVLVGNGNANTLLGTDDPDIIFGLGAGDILDGGAGNDLLCSGSGNNTLSGGDGDDTLIAESGSDTLNGGLGKDTLNAGKGANTLNGDAGNDKLIGGDGKDALNGGNDDDALIGGKSADKFSGGNGNDTANDFSSAEGDTQDGTLP